VERRINLNGTTFTVKIVYIFPEEAQAPAQTVMSDFVAGRIELKAPDLFLYLDLGGQHAYCSRSRARQTEITGGIRRSDPG
jgi:hypothetical protein